MYRPYNQFQITIKHLVTGFNEIWNLFSREILVCVSFALTAFGHKSAL